MISPVLFRKRSGPAHDFPGGIHPPQRKALSNRVPVRPGPMPRELVLPLNMHSGAPSRPVVSEGEQVLRGQRLAEATGAVSVPVHAPTSGRITAIGPRPIQHPSGLDAPCIMLEPDGENRSVDYQPVADWHQCEPAELVERIRQAGIAGLGGAGFPTAVKIHLREHHRVEQLILNAVECEPYITADDLLMRERAAEIVAGIRILEHLVEPGETLVAIEDNKPEAIAAMRSATAETEIRVVVVPTRYPSGGEKQLIQLLTGKEVRSGSIPIEVGVVCQNVGTARAIHRAIEHGEPLLSRVTTLTGEAVRRPGNYEVLLGTPVADLLDHGETDRDHATRLIMGGPMMGFAIHTPSVPVVKTTNCIIAATAEEMPEPEPEQPCIRCGACAEVCPARLLPQQLYWYASAGEYERAEQYDLMDCIECGACAWVCPSNIPLVQYYRHAKGELRRQAAEQEKADRARQRFEARKARLEREKAEKEARRQARMEAARKKKETAGDSTPEKTGERAERSSAGTDAPRAPEKQTPEKRIKSLRAAWKMAHKQWKEAHAALERMRRAGTEDSQALEEQQKQVERLENKAQENLQALETLQREHGEPATPTAPQSASQAQTGQGDTPAPSPRRELELALARAESAARRKAAALASARENHDEEHIAQLQEELDVLEREVVEKSRRLRSMEEDDAPQGGPPA